VRDTTTGAPPILPMVKRNHFSSSSRAWCGGVITMSLRMSRDSGPWTAMLCNWSVEDRTHAFSPRSWASWRSQTPL
jgi:hypothetical protein